MFFEEFPNKKAYPENNSRSNNPLNQPIKKSFWELKYFRKCFAVLHFAVPLTLDLTHGRYYLSVARKNIP